MSGLRSSQLARAAGVNQQTLRYYERRGLLAEPPRTLGGHRLYPPHAVTLLRIIKAAQRLGFTLDEVADLLDAGHHHHRRLDPTLSERITSKLSEIDAKLADLHTIRTSLLDALAAGCENLDDCATNPRCPLPFAALADTAAPSPARSGASRSPVPSARQPRSRQG